MTIRNQASRADNQHASARLRGAIAALCFLAGLAPGYANPSGITEFSLKNGMRVVVVEDHRLPIVAHSVWYKVGSVDDGPGLSGRAHFLEHMMFKATRKHPKRHLDRAVARAGGLNNATTSYDYTSYYEVIPKDRLDEMMSLEADRMTNIQFTDEELDLERGAILQERKMRIESSPLQRLKERVRAELYAGTPYEKMPAGTVTDINATTTADALQLYRRTYGPNNATLVVAGDVTADEVRALAETHYEPIPPLTVAPERPERLSLPPVKVTRLQERDAQLTQPSIGRYYRIPGEDHPDFAPLYILMNYLNVFTGRLNKELVQDQHVASSAGADIETVRLGGFLGVGGTAAPGVPLDKLEQSLNAIIEDIRMNGMPEEEVVRISKAIKSQTIFDQDDIVERMNVYGAYVTAGRSLAWIAALPDRFTGVTATDVKRVAATYLASENAISGVLLPIVQPVAQGK